jgi:hypothetical protein
MLTRFDSWPPTVGPTGSPIVAGEESVKRDVRAHRFAQPSPPERIVDITDDAGEFVGTRELSDTEFAAAQARYAEALAEFKRTGGLYLEEGATTYEICVKCADGGSGRAVGDGRRGAWVEWSC